MVQVQGSGNGVLSQCRRYFLFGKRSGRPRLKTRGREILPNVSLFWFAKAGTMHAQPPQQAGGTNPALPLFPRDTNVPRLLPARPRLRPRRAIRALIHELPQRLGLRQPELREAEAHLVTKQCLQKSFHPFGEKRVTAVVLAALPHGNERRPQSPLPALRNDDLTSFREIRHEATDQRELESPRPRARLNERLLARTNMVRHRREWLSHPRQSLAIAGFCSEAHANQLVAHFAAKNSGNAARIQAIAERDYGTQISRKIELPLARRAHRFLAVTKFNVPPVTGQKIQDFMQRVPYRFAVPLAGIVDGDDELQISLPAHLRASLHPVREFNGRRHEHGVVNNRFPFRYAVSFEPCG